MDAIHGLTALRQAVESRTGALPDDVWRDVAPPMFPDAFDHSDLDLLVKEVRQHHRMRALQLELFQRVRLVVGIPADLSTETAAQMAIVDVLDGVLSAIKGEVGTSISDVEAAALGRYVAAAIAARAIATNRPIERHEAMAGVLGYVRPSSAERLRRASDDPANELYSFAGRAHRSGVSDDFALYSADRQVRETLFAGHERALAGLAAARTLSDVRSSIERLPHFDMLGRPSLWGTWDERWIAFEAHSARELGRSFASVDAYRMAVVRARKRLGQLASNFNRSAEQDLLSEA